jgi:hypothetical protein
MRGRHKYALIGLLWILSLNLKAQILNIDSMESKLKQVGNYFLYRNHDTTYIKSYAQYLTLRLIAVNKYNFFRVRDRFNGTAVRYRPEYGINFGLGFAYKWLGFDLAFNFGLQEDENLPNSETLNLQARIFSSRQFIEGTLQYFYGHQLDNISGIQDDFIKPAKIRQDIRTISIGIQYLFAFRYDKFSLKAPFVFNEIQLKNAGSPILGASFDYFNMSSDSSVIPNALADYFDEKLHLVDLSMLSVALNMGYIHTFVWKKKFFLTLGFIPGLNFNLGDSKAETREVLKWNVSYKIKSMNAIGYSVKKFFAGIQLQGDLNNIRLAKKLNTLYSNGSLKLIFGYRFVKKE